MNKKLLIVLLTLFIIPFVSANWITNPLQSPTSYASQTCTGILQVCGFNTGTTFCYDMSTLNPPSSNATSTTSYDPSNSKGGFILNYTAYDGSAPFCNNAGSYWCERNESFYASPINRQTICLANTWGNATLPVAAGSCISGYQNCTGGIELGCTIQTGVTAQNKNNTVYAASCGYSCSSGWQNCSGQTPSVQGCNFQTGVTSCTTGLGEPGTISAGCGCTALPKPPFYFNNMTSGFGDNTLLARNTKASGTLINVTNNVTGKTFIVNNESCVVYPDGSKQCTAASGSSLPVNFSMYNTLLYVNGTGNLSQNSKLTFDGFNLFGNSLLNAEFSVVGFYNNMHIRKGIRKDSTVISNSYSITSQEESTLFIDATANDVPIYLPDVASYGIVIDTEYEFVRVDNSNTYTSTLETTDGLTFMDGTTSMTLSKDCSYTVHLNGWFLPNEWNVKTSCSNKPVSFTGKTATTIPIVNTAGNDLDFTSGLSYTNNEIDPNKIFTYGTRTYQKYITSNEDIYDSSIRNFVANTSSNPINVNLPDVGTYNTLDSMAYTVYKIDGTNDLLINTVGAYTFQDGSIVMNVSNNCKADIVLDNDGSNYPIWMGYISCLNVSSGGSGSGDGTGGWTNTSLITTTPLKVGINNSNPQSALDVNGTVRIGHTIVFPYRSAQGINNSIYTDSSDNLYISSGLGSSKTINFVRQGTGNIFTISSTALSTTLDYSGVNSVLSGNMNSTNLNVNNGLLFTNSTGTFVGINTRVPSSTLHVNGTVNITTNAWLNGSLICTAANGVCSSGVPTSAQFTNLNVTGVFNASGTAFYGSGEICTSTNGLCSSSLPSSAQFTNLNITGTFNVTSSSAFVGGSPICTPGNALCAGGLTAQGNGWANTSDTTWTDKKVLLQQPNVNYGLMMNGSVNGAYELSIVNPNAGNDAFAGTCYYNNLSNMDSNFACIGVNGFNYSNANYTSQSPNDLSIETTNGDIHVDVRDSTKNIEFYVGGTSYTNKKIEITNNVTTVSNGFVNSGAGSSFYLMDEMCGIKTSTGAQLYGFAIASGTTALALGYVTHPCQDSLRSSTSANSGYVITTGATSLVATSGTTFETVFSKSPRSGANTTTIRLGFFDSTTATVGTDVIQLEIINETAGGYVTTGAAGGKWNTTTKYNLTPNAATNDYYKLTIEVINASQVNFKIYNSTDRSGVGGRELLWESNVTDASVPITASGRQTGAGAMGVASAYSAATDIALIDYILVYNKYGILR